MPIKPIDFQVMLPKATEVSKMHSDERNKGILLQQQQAEIVQNHAEVNLRQVHTQDKAQEAKIREKQEKDKSNKKESKKKSKGNYDNKKQTEVELKTSFIDIKL